jgi:hypothetical protein
VTSILGDHSPQQNAHVSPCGDLDGDGVDDFAVTSRLGVFPAPGYTYILHGNRAWPSSITLGVPGIEASRIDGVISWSALDEYRSAIGDYNGDGLRDVVFRERTRVAAPDLPDMAGQVYVIFGLPSEASFIRGDTNGDGSINITDPLVELDSLFKGAGTLICPDAADTDDDGKVTLTDAIYILNHLFQSGPGPELPYPGCGRDETEDGLKCEGSALCE